MKIKSLLLGSAAASMLAVSGAQAADPIIYAEPESMEYVRICDVYGAGFFYIPGTENCMRISGYARYQMGWSSVVDGWDKYARGRLNFDVRSETEWGTLRGFVRLEINSGQSVNSSGTASGTIMPWMFISMSTAQGELLAGYLESAWVWSGPLGNYGPTLSDTGAFSYGFQRRSQIRYTFTAPEGFFGVLSLEDNNRPLQTRQWMPDVVGKAGINQAWGGAYGAFGYDAVDESWAARVGAQLNVPAAPGSILRGEFYWANSINNAYAPQMIYAGTPGTGAARWSAAVGYQHQFNPQFAAQVGYQYLSGFGAGNPRHHYVDGSLIWTPVRDLEVRTEVRYGSVSRAGVASSDSWGGFLRFQRNF